MAQRYPQPTDAKDRGLTARLKTDVGAMRDGRLYERDKVSTRKAFKFQVNRVRTDALMRGCGAESQRDTQCVVCWTVRMKACF